MDKETIKAVKATLTIKDCVEKISFFDTLLTEAKINRELDTDEIIEAIDHYKECMKVLTKESYHGEITTGLEGSAVRSSSCSLEHGYIEIIAKGKTYKCFTDVRHNLVSGRTYKVKCLLNNGTMTASRVTILK